MSVDNRDQIERDQDDFAARLSLDTLLAPVSIKLERKGVTEADIDLALSTLNERDGKIGAILVVLQPSLVPTTPDAPGPEFKLRLTVQVITQALFNDGDTGTGLSNGRIAARVRQLGHRFTSGGGVWSFDGMEPLVTDPGKISNVVYFTRRAHDDELPRCGLPLIDPDEGAVPQEITLTCGTIGAAIYYTLDGSYPSSANPTAQLYAAPFTVATAARLRAAAQKTGLQQSGIAEASYT